MPGSDRPAPSPRALRGGTFRHQWAAPGCEAGAPGMIPPAQESGIDVFQ